MTTLRVCVCVCEIIQSLIDHIPKVGYDGPNKNLFHWTESKTIKMVELMDWIEDFCIVAKTLLLPFVIMELLNEFGLASQSFASSQWECNR